MVVISPVKIWNNGVEATATLFNLWCVNDNLSNSATFCYEMLTETQQSLSRANLTMTGTAYEGWQTNEYAYEWAATQLNISILHPYTTTTTSTELPTTTSTTTSSGTTTSTTTTVQPSTTTSSTTKP